MVSAFISAIMTDMIRAELQACSARAVQRDTDELAMALEANSTEEGVKAARGGSVGGLSSKQVGTGRAGQVVGQGGIRGLDG